ncbi:MAG: methyltransferase domain-containing protein [Burkholderiaceae bacterium]
MSAPIDLNRVRRLFGDPARVIESDFLRREIAARMHERLQLVRLAPQRVLDAGCGTGADFPALQKHYPDAQVIGIDGAHSMLRAAHMRQVAALSSMSRLVNQWLPKGMRSPRGLDAGLLCGDIGQVPLGVGTLDLVWSNLVLHWHPQPDKVFVEWRRLLRIDGLLMFSCFGPDTFKQLRTAFAAEPSLSSHARLLPFVDMHDFGDMLLGAGFATPVMDMETINVTYETVDRLLADVRAWGGNPLATRPRGLIGRAAFARLTGVLERMRNADGRIELTFEVIYGHAFRPPSRTTSNGESVVRLDLRRKDSAP